MSADTNAPSTLATRRRISQNDEEQLFANSCRRIIPLLYYVFLIVILENTFNNNGVGGLTPTLRRTVVRTGKQRRCSSLSQLPNSDFEGDDDALSNEERKRRLMEQVRQLQDSFYSTSSATCIRNDIIKDLPLYRRFGQTELPGRSTLVYVADPKHTNMFESIIRGPRPWYVGQLNLPGEGNHYDDFGRLEGWRDRIALLEKGTDVEEKIEVVGTLLVIVDYCRVNDGRLILLVQGLERFIVERARQERPYPIADVRCFPDEEDLDIAISAGLSQKQGRSWALQQALLESKCDWHLPGGGEIAVEDLASADLAQLMPLAPFHPVPERESVNVEDDEDTGEKDDDLPTEGILREFSSFTCARDSSNLPSSDDLELSLWKRIEDYVRVRDLGYGVIPQELIKLLPPETRTSDSSLYQYAIDNNMLASSSLHSDRKALRHGAHRRQRRLAYAATVLLGGTARSTGLLNRGMRQKLLEVPSTKGRLWALIECFDEFLHLAN